DEAPVFTLHGTKDGAGKGQGFRDYSLTEWRGKSVVLAFYPAAYTPV
ncbi:MAG: redoxin domain-containing protein, partial [Deltaproteobacteria bacterium]|nr:redoxin domain-containing protein [Deltaproteobacteria bacterium]